MSNLVHQFHIGDEAEPSFLDVVNKLIDLINVNFGCN
jgi:hypothetical protein